MHNQFAIEGIFLSRSWWNTDHCPWMPGVGLTWGCSYLPPPPVPRQKQQEGEKKTVLLQHTHAVFTITYDYSLGFVMRAWEEKQEACFSVGAGGSVCEGAVGGGGSTE